MNDFSTITLLMVWVLSCLSVIALAGRSARLLGQRL